MSKPSPRAAFAPAVEADAVDLASLGPMPDAANALTVQADEAAEPAPIPYDPAEYRWVPVRRRPRLDGWTEEKQRRFIETLADTGLVNVAAKAVGMTRESAYRLRRAAHGAAFARAWDAARQHAGGLIEDIAFERAIEGTEQEVIDRYGDVIATRLVHDNRLLQWLLARLKPERYARTAAPEAPPADAPTPPPEAALEAQLRAMEPALPAPAEALLDPETLQHELTLAEIADGALPAFLHEQPPQKSDAERAQEEAAARAARGKAAHAKRAAGGTLSDEEFADECFHLDPLSNARPRPRRRRGAGPAQAPPV